MDGFLRKMSLVKSLKFMRSNNSRINNNTQMMKLDKLINRYIKNRNFVKIKRKFNKVSVDLTGYLLDHNSNFLLIHKEEELYLNGYAIIRKDQLNAIRHNKYDKTIENIILKEGVLDKSINPNFKIDLSTWKSIFLNLKQADKHVIIECEKKKPAEF